MKGAGKGNRIQPVGQQKILRQQAVDLAAGKGVIAGFDQQAAHLPFDVGEDVAGRLLRLHRKNRKTKWLEQLRGCLLCLLLGECSFDRRDFPKTGEQSAVRSAVQQGKGALSRPTEDGKEGALLNLPRFLGAFTGYCWAQPS